MFFCKPENAVKWVSLKGQMLNSDSCIQSDVVHDSSILCTNLRTILLYIIIYIINCLPCLCYVYEPSVDPGIITDDICQFHNTAGVEMTQLLLFPTVTGSWLRNLDLSPFLYRWRGLTAQSKVAVTSQNHSGEDNWTAWTGKRPSTSLSIILVMRIIASWETTTFWAPQVINTDLMVTHIETEHWGHVLIWTPDELWLWAMKQTRGMYSPGPWHCCLSINVYVVL